MKRRVVGTIVALATLPALSCGSDKIYKYEAEVRWTENGVPHVLAKDFGSAAYGQAWAFSKLHGCVLADQVIKVRSERAAFFGPGDNDEHLTSDFAHLALGIYAKAEAGLETLDPTIVELIDGYVAGYNAYLASGGDLGGDCDGKDWVRPISSTDLIAHYLELGTLASGRQLQDAIATATPPGTAAMAPPAPIPNFAAERQDYGSNGWAIGADRSASGGGMVVGNPHFPWAGELMFYENHMTIPGVLDVYGGSLMAAPGIQIGFNENVAWTHTVSSGYRMTMYNLELDPADPTTYIFDGAPMKMLSTTHSIEVLQDDGSLKEVKRTLYSSHYGPILNLDPFGWGTDFTLTFRDGNENNLAIISQFMGMDLATDMDDFQRVHAEVNGLPWINTISASSDGRAWYADSTTVPLLSDATLATWQDAVANDFLTGLLLDNGVILLDGTTSASNWKEEPDARVPGLTPFSQAPQLERSDFVYNANDSHWLSNPAQPLEGYNPFYGAEGTPRSPRTRMNMTMLTEVGPGGASGEDGKFTLEELQTAIVSNRGMMQELLRTEVVALCQQNPSVMTSGETVDLTQACQVLADWDGRLDLASKGGHVWREFLADFSSASGRDAGPLFEVPFDAADPIGTPNTLSSDTDPLLQALGEAVRRLNSANIALDAELGDIQFTKKGAEIIPLHGGHHFEGATNIAIYGPFKTTLEPDMPRDSVVTPASDLTKEGYVVNSGSSFMMTMEFTADGPKAATFVTYSQSHDEDSPYFSDFTKRFSDKDWKPVRFTQDDIESDPDYEVESLRGE